MAPVDLPRQLPAQLGEDRSLARQPAFAPVGILLEAHVREELATVEPVVARLQSSRSPAWARRRSQAGWHHGVHAAQGVHDVDEGLKVDVEEMVDRNAGDTFD